MHKFIDAENRVWTVEIDLVTRRTIKQETNFDLNDLLNVTDENSFKSALESLEIDLVEDMLFYCCLDQIENQKLGQDNPEEFAKLSEFEKTKRQAKEFFKVLSKKNKEGNSVYVEAMEAWQDSLEDFFRLNGSEILARSYRMTVQKVRKARKQVQEAITDEKMDSMIEKHLAGETG